MRGVPSERRRAARLGCRELGWVRSVRISPGCDARLENLSAGGALCRLGTRLLPGRPATLHVTTSTGVVTVPGVVARASVSDIDATGLTYEVAMRFVESMRWPGDVV